MPTAPEQTIFPPQVDAKRSPTAARQQVGGFFLHLNRPRN